MRPLSPLAPVVDLGSGRGEWLLLLREAGYKARGIEQNPVMLERCERLALDVVDADALQGLRELPPDSTLAITGFHFVEHVAFPALLELLAECMRVLIAGGMVVFETPNPENVAVGSCNFYFDPTHRHPLPSATLRFALEFSGLRGVRVQYLHPAVEDASRRKRGSPAERRIAGYFDGAQDYAVIGYKPPVDA